MSIDFMEVGVKPQVVFEKKDLPVVKFPAYENGKDSSTVYMVFQRPIAMIGNFLQHEAWNLPGEVKQVLFPCQNVPKIQSAFPNVQCPGCLIHNGLKEATGENKTELSPKLTYVMPVLVVEKVEKGKPAGTITPSIWFVKNSLVKGLEQSENEIGDLTGRLFSFVKTGKGTATRYAATHIGPSGLDMSSFEEVAFKDVMPLVSRFPNPEDLANHVAKQLQPYYGEYLTSMNLPE